MLVWKGEYLPFGEIFTEDRDPDGDSVEVEQPFRFPGQYEDAETGLYYNYFRDYDPRIGRYVEADPIGLSGGVNIFSFAAMNPISYIDPNGLSPSDLENCIKSACEWYSLCQNNYENNYKLCLASCNLLFKYIWRLRELCIAGCTHTDKKAKEWCKNIYNKKVEECYKKYGDSDENECDR